MTDDVGLESRGWIRNDIQEVVSSKLGPGEACYTAGWGGGESLWPDQAAGGQQSVGLNSGRVGLEMQIWVVGARGDDKSPRKGSVIRDKQREEREGTDVEGKVSRERDFHRQGQHPGSKGSCFKEAGYGASGSM